MRKNYFYIALGFIAFGLGAVGVILPIIPTTPFLLLASFCFARGSKRFHSWFINTKLYKKQLEKFVEEKAMTLKQKIFILGIVGIMIAFPLFFVDKIWVKAVLAIIVLFKIYYFSFKIKTIKG
ncbi:MAG: YbaN family protein [Clostridium sp.]